MLRVIFYIIFLAIFLINGCSKNPLTPQALQEKEETKPQQALLSFGGENNTSSAKIISNYMSKKARWSNWPSDGNEEIVVAVEKVDITTDGKVWYEIFRGNENIIIASSGTTVFGSKISIAPDEYHGVRIWFGDKIKGKSQTKRSGVTIEQQPIYSIQGQYYERNDFTNYGKNNPFVFDTVNGYLSSPIKTEIGKELRLVIRFLVTEISMAIITANLPNYGPPPYYSFDYNQRQWEEYRDTYFKQMITVGTTRISGY